VTIEQVRPEKTGDVVKRQIADEIILVPVRKTAEELDTIYSINSLAGEIWELIDGRRTVADIKKALLNKYDVSPAELEKDLTEFIEQLKSETSSKGCDSHVRRYNISMQLVTNPGLLSTDLWHSREHISQSGSVPEWT